MATKKPIQPATELAITRLREKRANAKAEKLRGELRRVRATCSRYGDDLKRKQNALNTSLEEWNREVAARHEAEAVAMMQRERADEVIASFKAKAAKDVTDATLACQAAEHERDAHRSQLVYAFRLATTGAHRATDPEAKMLFTIIAQELEPRGETMPAWWTAMLAGLAGLALAGVAAYGAALRKK